MVSGWTRTARGWRSYATERCPAEQVVSERFGLHDWDACWAWICLTELWHRWWPEKACLELLDDKVQRSYDADQRNDFVTSNKLCHPAYSVATG